MKVVKSRFKDTVDHIVEQIPKASWLRLEDYIKGPSIIVDRDTNYGEDRIIFTHGGYSNRQYEKYEFPWIGGEKSKEIKPIDIKENGIGTWEIKEITSKQVPDLDKIREHLFEIYDKLGYDIKTMYYENKTDDES